LSRLMRACAIVVLFASGNVHADDKAPKRLEDALRLVKNVSPQNNKYVFGGNVVVFDPACEMKSDCSGLLNALLKHSDGFDAERMRSVFGSTRPTAKRYFDAIASRKEFADIVKVEAIHGGDILAIAYVKNYKGRATGHVLLAAGSARTMEVREPLVEATTQWEVPVIDSATNVHGPTDTRLGKGDGGKNSTGIGKGVMRLYADREGKVAGYTWSSTSGAKGSFYSQEDRPLRIGRLRVAK
jgi:hypothetical protein